MPLQESGNRKRVYFQEKHSAGSDDPADFREHSIRIPHVVQGVAADCQINALVFKRYSLRCSIQVVDRLPKLLHLLAKANATAQDQRLEGIQADPQRKLRKK